MGLVWLPLLLLSGAVGCASTTAARPPEALYLKVEVQQGGRTVASPHLLGFEGRHIIVERKPLAAKQADYRLVLTPHEQGGGYGVSFDLELPGGHQRGQLGLLHGEERAVTLEDETRLKILLMRVDSPEFRALMRPTGRSSTI